MEEEGLLHVLEKSFKTVKRKYNISSDDIVPFHRHVAKKVCHLLEAKVEQERQLRLIEPVDRELAQEVLELDQMIHRLAKEILEKRSSGPELIKKFYLEKLKSNENVTEVVMEDTKEAAPSESANYENSKCDIEDYEELISVSKESEKIYSELASNLVQTHAKLQTTLESITSGSGTKSKIDLLMENGEVELASDVEEGYQDNEETQEESADTGKENHDATVSSGKESTAKSRKTRSRRNSALKSNIQNIRA